MEGAEKMFRTLPVEPYAPVRRRINRVKPFGEKGVQARDVTPEGVYVFARTDGGALAFRTMTPSTVV